MAVQSDTSSISYTGNNSTVTTYAVPFYFLENSHLSAIAKVTATGVESAVTLTNHTGAGDANGGTVRTAVAVPATSTLTIFRTVPATQTTTYQEGGDFPAASHERALDKLTLLAQQNERAVERSFRVTEGSGVKNEVVAVPNTLLGLDASNQPKALTVDQVKSLLSITGVTLDVDAGMKTFADAGERALAAPDFTGQLGTQRDTADIYISTGTAAGDWSLVDENMSLADFASGFFTADATGRGKFATGFVDAGLIADDTITNAKIKSDAAIAGTKISPDFGSQDVATTGQAAVGTAINANAKLNVGGTMPAQTAQRALAIAPAFDNNASAGAQAILTGVATAANGGSAYTIPSVAHFYANQGTLHADSTVTNQYGLLVAATLDDATNNYGVWTQIPASGTANWNIYASGAAPNYFAGVTLIGTSTSFGAGGISVIPDNIAGAPTVVTNRENTTSSSIVFQFRNAGTAVGSISHTNTATFYNTSSDYRLKENLTPMIGALVAIEQLQPCEFTWKSDGSIGRGFIAHELQAVVPEAVTGEKDAVNADGTPEYQGVDASKLVPYLVSAIKELKTRVEQLEAQLQP